MKFGIRIYGTDPAGLVRVAQTAEAVGYESLWRGDHHGIPMGSSVKYPFAGSDSTGFDEGSPMLEAITVLAFLAGHTDRVRLATGICVVPYREPIVLARSITSLDVLSGGRFIFGVGTGWLKAEFDLLRRDYGARGTWTTEFLQLIRDLWTLEQIDFEGECIAVEPMKFYPKPASQPHPPIVVGGESPRALTRAARYGDGWYAHEGEISGLQRKIEHLRALRSGEPRRNDLPFEISVQVRPDVSTGYLQQLEAIGVDRVVVQSGSLGLLMAEDMLPDIEGFAEKHFEVFDVQ